MDSFLQKRERIDDVNCNIRLAQNPDGLTFGTDALLLASYVRARPGAAAVEIGGGSGIVSLLCLSRNTIASVDCIEVQPAYAALIEKNAAMNGMQTRLHAFCDDVRHYAQLPDRIGKADVVFCNPPYMKTTGLKNRAPEKNIARHEVFGDIEEITAAAARLLRYSGKFFCVYRPDRIVDLLAALRKNRLEPKRVTFVHADTATPPCLLLLEATRGGRCSAKVTRPLYIYRAPHPQPRIYTEEMKGVMRGEPLPQTAE